MKTRYSIIIISLLTLLATGCKKDNNRIRLLVEPMNPSKVLINSAYPDGAWGVGETINVNGQNCTIQQHNEGYYYIEATTSLPNMVALYPAAINTGGNEVEVANSTSSHSITLHSLAVNFHDDDNNGVLDGSYEVCFPMAAVATTGSSSLQFRHLTAGLELTLRSSGTPRTITKLKIRLYGQNAIAPLAHPDADGTSITTRWAVNGPLVPYVYWEGVYNGNSSLEIMYADEMVFPMLTNGVSGVIIPTGGITFRVPATPCNISEIDIVGYGVQGEQIFFKQRQLIPNDAGAYPLLERNILYPVPTIEI